MTTPKKSLTERLAEARARRNKGAHRNAIADRKAVSQANAKIRKANKTNG